ncbi:polysaccharide deacetylase family protein [Sulfoacidibacillus thermotolerans]|uniref:NodB homology domain-containing protein n=1 Tax=Sulfoacidibacillus thermotolerans TaxID=1765684 RepID=A0A2U3DAW0_SULT2|nr:polysaccharide deacetylase family protein [Sulfoacidibacillus thermotolerans]PWI58411.1 hypothetical protein BM613_04160 [Sulfoacidibacillus thermotolerans]
MTHSIILNLIASSSLFLALTTTRTEFSDPDLLHRIPTTQPVVAFTFDDGPDPNFTPKILKELAEHHANATFFVIGRKAERYPNLIKMEIANGNEIGNHSYSHPPSWTPASALQEIQLTQERVYNITGSYPTLFRPPMGVVNSGIRRATKQTGLRIILWAWDQDTRDWSGRKASAIAKQVVDHLHPGDIVLFHDGAGNQSNTVTALHTIFPQLEQRHFRVTTVSELLRVTSTKTHE